MRPIEAAGRDSAPAVKAHSPFRRASAFAGLALAAGGAVAALASPLVALAHRSFAAHMVQHELIAFFIPPFLLIFAGALPWRPTGIASTVAAAAWRPIPALVISTAVLWTWHLPALYGGALDSDIMHVIEHATIFIAFLLFWRPLTGPGSPPATLRSNVGRAAYLVAGAMQGMVLGAVLVFAEAPFYAHYVEANGTSLAALADQRLGGAIMWFSGPVIFGLTAAMVFRDRK